MTDTTRHEATPEEIRSRPLTRLGVTSTIQTQLRGFGIKTIGDLLALSRKELLEIEGLGRKSIDSIEEALGYLSMNLREAQKVYAEATPQAITPGVRSASQSVMKPKRRHKSETERATSFARAQTKAASNASRRRPGPNLRDPHDRERVIELYNTVTMEVEEAQWLYGIARNTAYSACNELQIATKKFPDRLKVVTQVVFGELFPRPPKWLREGDAWSDMTADLNEELQSEETRGPVLE